MVPCVIGKRIGRAQAVRGGPDLNGVRVDESILDGIILSDDADSSAECGGVRNAGGGRDPVFQRKRGTVLKELILRIHPVALTIERTRMVVGVEADESRRTRTSISFGGTAAAKIIHVHAVAARAPAVRCHG